MRARANILMDPGNSYLCVVPERGKGDGKAFLLADDTKITDRPSSRSSGGVPEPTRVIDFFAIDGNPGAAGGD
ncbi:hypothetical protein [Streptomyces canus]|uniref:hypothetical protein n=1 Tax=Streptomyces canus TaxID=58343 RepID=UPI003255FCBF